MISTYTPLPAPTAKGKQGQYRFAPNAEPSHPALSIP